MVNLYGFSTEKGLSTTGLNTGTYRIYRRPVQNQRKSGTKSAHLMNDRKAVQNQRGKPP